MTADAVFAVGRPGLSRAGGWGRRAFLVLSVLVAACLGGRGIAPDPVTIEVRNDHFLDVTILAVRGGASVRIGTVGGHDTGELTLPETFRMPLDLRVRADPIGSRESWLSGTVPLVGGEVVEVHISPSLSQSTVSIR